MKKFASILLSMLMATGAIAAASAETYTGTAQGIGEVSVTLTVEDGKITAAEVVGENETKGIGYEPCADGTYADAIVAAQGVDFDSISGATVTSNAVKDATKKAMAAAGLIEAEDTTVADAECDVVIVGAGGAGMTAALQAVDSGVNSVIIVEKGGSTGGNTSRATGGMNAAKTAYQDKNEWSDATTTAVEKTIATAKEKYGDKIGDLIATVEAQFEAYKANPTGYFDSVELFALDTMVGGKCLNNLDLVMALTGNSAEAIDWLATKDAHLTNVGSFGGARAGSRACRRGRFLLDRGRLLARADERGRTQDVRPAGGSFRRTAGRVCLPAGGREGACERSILDACRQGGALRGGRGRRAAAVVGGEQDGFGGCGYGGGAWSSMNGGAKACSSLSPRSWRSASCRWP